MPCEIVVLAELFYVLRREIQIVFPVEDVSKFLIRVLEIGVAAVREVVDFHRAD